MGLPVLLLLLLAALAAPSRTRALTESDCMVVTTEPARWALDTPGGGGADGSSAGDTQRQPCLGYLIGIGVQKGGTSSLWSYVACGAHPRIWARPDVKELEWFDYVHAHGSTLHDYHDSLLKHQSPAAHLHTLCPAAGSTAFREARAAGRRRCRHNKHLLCARRALPDGPPDEGLAPYNDSAVRPAPFYLTDVTPSYIMHPDVPVFVRAIVPEARLVVLLRDPVKRAASAFSMVWDMWRRPEEGRDDPEEFKRAFTEEMMWDISMIQSCYKQVRVNSSSGTPPPLLGPEMRTCLGLGPSVLGAHIDQHRVRMARSYTMGSIESRRITHGMYADELALWFSLFPKEQILVWVSEDFKAEPVKHVQELVAWLGLDPSLTLTKLKAHSARVGKYRFQLPGETLEALRTFYKPHNQRLFDLLRSKGFGAQASRMQELWE